MADKGTETNPVGHDDLPWTVPTDGDYYFDGKNGPALNVALVAGMRVWMISPSGTAIGSA